MSRMTQAPVARIHPADIPYSVRRSTLRAWSERVLLGLLFVLFVIRAFIPAWKHLGSDFANYYLAASLYRQGYPVERVYDWTWFQRQKDHAAIERPLVGFIPSTLTSSLLVLPLSLLSPLQANRCWLIVSLGLLLVTAALLKRISSLTWERIGVLIFLALAPLYKNFLLGQVHMVMLLLLTLAAYFYFRDWHFLSGATLAIATALKIYPALFLLFFLLKRQWRAAAGLVCGSVGALIMAAGLFGVDACRIYFHEILPWGLRGEIIDPYATGWDSLNALFHRLFLFEPELNPAPVMHLPYLYALLQSLTHTLILVTFLWALASDHTHPTRAKLEWGIYCFLLLLISSEPLPYHFVILILTVVLLVDDLTTRGLSIWAGVTVGLFVFVCIPYDRIYRVNPKGWESVFFFPRLAWMLVLGGVLLWLLVAKGNESLPARLRSRSFVVAIAASVVITTVGFVLQIRHLSGQFSNYAARVTTSEGSTIAVDPAVTTDSVFYGSLVPQFMSAHDVYRIRRLRAGSVTSFGGGGDWFHPAAMPHGNWTWAELAAKEKSQIVRFESSPAGSSDNVTQVADDAEQPVVSDNGQWLAYIRELHGRGSLWIRPMNRQHGEINSERELVGPQFDVREAAFSPEDQLVFSSWQTGKGRLYSFDIPSGALAQIAAIKCSARYPAFSPNGQCLAFSCERSGVWQLMVMNRRTAEQHQLTTADCNSITPAWSTDSKSLIYATDCGRALGITALSKLSIER
jgi:hypothetical protein